ncbi:unnamed protein product [Alopecurus aequalis]
MDMVESNTNTKSPTRPRTAKTSTYYCQNGSLPSALQIPGDALDDPSGNYYMEPPSKRIRTAPDRLSDLPDCLIQSILSLLESQQVVRLSVLSRRWRHLWRSVPCIDIDLTLFRRRDRCQDQNCCNTEHGLTKTTCKKEWQPFEEFGNNLLLLNSDARSLDKLRIHVPALGSDDRQARDACSRWVKRGINCSPCVVIDVHLEFAPTLGWVFLPDLGSNSSRLTRLLLHGVSLDGAFAKQLCSGCPLLEELSLTKCAYQFGKILSILSRSLRHLTIADCFMWEGVVVTAPRLTSLRASLSTISCPYDICVTDISSSVSASICVSTFSQISVSTFGHINANFWEKLRTIFNVKHLELVGRMMDKIEWISDKVPKFQNVRTLVINRYTLTSKANIQALDRFLQSTPSLKKLTLQNREFSYNSKRRAARAKWRHVALESQHLMSFKCDNLELIEIKHREDDNVDELFELLMGLWRNLGKANIKLTKV